MRRSTNAADAIHLPSVYLTNGGVTSRGLGRRVRPQLGGHICHSVTIYAP